MKNVWNQTKAGSCFALRKKGIVSIISNNFKPTIHKGEIREVSRLKFEFFPYNSKGQATSRSFSVDNYDFYDSREEAYAAAKEHLLAALDRERQKVERFFAEHPKAE